MKTLHECKDLFKDLFMDCMEEQAFEKSIFESTELTKFDTFCETMKFIYGQKFERIRDTWAQEALNEFYKMK